MGFNSGLNVTSTRRTLSACNPTKVKIHKIQFCFTASATFFVNCSCLVQKWMLQFGCRLHWWWRQAHFGVQTWPEISLKMSHFKQRLHEVFSGRINPLCLLLQSRTEPYCWKPFTYSIDPSFHHVTFGRVNKWQYCKILIICNNH